MSTNRGKDRRKRLELCNWREEVPVTVQSKGDHYSAKAKARGIKTEVEIAKRMGIEPELVSGILDEALGFEVRTDHPFQHGDVVTLMLTPDPAKSEYDQTPVSKTVTVE